MINILYSNDYELYLGGNHLPEDEVVLPPTEALLSTCNDLGIPMTHFVDVACLWRYRELGESWFPDAVEAQLLDAARNGHDVQAHLHPHWPYTSIVREANGATRYKTDPDTFLLAPCAQKAGRELRACTVDVLRRMKAYFENLLSPVVKDYRCIAFRAGGFGLQPGAREIIGGVCDAGIRIDSSIVPGMQVHNNINRIDFSDVPKRGNYFVDSEDGLTRAAEQGVFEIPVAAIGPGTARAILARALVRKMVRRVQGHFHFPDRGTTIQTGTSDSSDGVQSRMRHLLRHVWNGWDMLEIGPDPHLMRDVTRAYIRQYQGDSDLYFALICHSKSISDGHLRSLRRFHAWLQREYHDHIRAITFQQAARQLNL